MKISRNNIAFSALRSKMIRARRTKIKSSSFSSSSRTKSSTAARSLAQKSALTQSANKKNTSSAKTLLDETKSNYTTMKTAAENMTKYLDKLMADGEDSLFGTGEKAPDKDKIVSNINEMAEAYNDCLTSLTDEGGTINEMYARQLKNLVISNSSKLEKIGITKDKYDKLKIDKEKLNNAETEDLKALFQGEGGFADKLLGRSDKIKENADTNLNSLNNATYSSLLSNYGTSGSRFNSWG